MSKVYLGDAVYVDSDEHHVILTTEDGISTSNEIFLDNSVVEAFILYLKKEGKIHD
ncbi:hypothetical protein KAR91_47940 [Candidatus Pacearchaeota archaeon]|nr:hypothetical protein [Candidatus Pacearchaeota archaeon]